MFMLFIQIFLQLFTTQYGLLLVANLIPLNITFLSFVFDITFPIYIGFFKGAIEFSVLIFAVLLQIETIWIKYWIEFKWKSVKPIDDKFVLTSLIIINTVISICIAISVVILSGGNIPMTYGIVSTFDRWINMNSNDAYFLG